MSKFNRYGEYDDWAQEIDSDADQRAHDENRCLGFPACFACFGERALAEHEDGDCDPKSCSICAEERKKAK